jgi:hypothetical protein
VVVTWFAARRLFGPRGVLAVMAATLSVQMSFGGLALIDPRQQVALLLPFWAFVWLTVSLALGHDAAVLPWVVAGSLVLQTHFSYAYLSMTLVVVGVAGYVVSSRPRWRTQSFRWHVAGGLGLAVLLWAHTLWDQFFGSGNVSAVFGHAEGTGNAGLATGAQILADSPLSAPFWWPGAVRHFRAPWSHSTAISVLILVGWFGLLTVAFVVARRRASRRDQLTCGLAAALIAVALVTAARIPPASAFGSLPQNYFWLWPITLFAVVSLLAVAAHGVPLQRVVTVGLAAAVVVAALLVPAGQVFPQWDIPAEATEAGDRVVGQMRQQLADLPFAIDAPIVVDGVEARVAVDDYYNMLAELTRAGFDFHFVDGAGDLNRFGTERCETGDERWRLRVVVGHARPQLTKWDFVLGQTDGPSGDVQRELDVLRTQVLERLRAGEITIDGEELDDPDGQGQQLVQALAKPTPVPAQVWLPLSVLDGRDSVHVPPSYQADWERWLDLEYADLASHLLVYLTPNYFPADPGCDGDAT